MYDPEPRASRGNVADDSFVSSIGKARSYSNHLTRIKPHTVTHGVFKGSATRQTRSTNAITLVRKTVVLLSGRLRGCRAGDPDFFGAEFALALAVILAPLPSLSL